MKPEFFSNNRVALSKQLHGGIAVLSAHALMQRGNDAAFFFEQEANFWYLTGIEEPDWWLIVDSQRDTYLLVAPEIDEIHRIFDGGLSNEAAQKIAGADGVIDRKDVAATLRDLAKKHSVVYALGEHPHKNHFNFVENPAQKRLLAVLERTFNSTQDCRKELAQLRAIKQSVELTAIKKAIRLTSEAFETVKHRLPELKYEYEVEAEFDYLFKKHGATHAYDPIIAAGKNACTLHYIKNSQSLKKDSLLLMDIGARVSGYAADISRTYAINVPTERQIAIHAAVEHAHRDIIALLKPGLSVVEYHQKVDAIMKQSLMSVQLIHHADDNQYRKYFPHAVSHGLGIDVHDSLGAAEIFKEGMVLTVEPGIYIPEEGIGVRIEDDILITAKGHTNLSGSLSTDMV